MEKKDSLTHTRASACYDNWLPVNYCFFCIFVARIELLLELKWEIDTLKGLLFDTILSLSLFVNWYTPTWTEDDATEKKQTEIEINTSDMRHSVNQTKLYQNYYYKWRCCCFCLSCVLAVLFFSRISFISACIFWQNGLLTVQQCAMANWIFRSSANTKSAQRALRDRSKQKFW